MIQNSKALDVWDEELSSKAYGTRVEYLRHFDIFLKRYDMTAEGLYEIRKADLESDDSRDHRNIERKVASLMSEMVGDGYSASYARGISKAVGSFLLAQGLDLNLRAREKPRVVYNGQNMALIDDIRMMWRDSAGRNRERNRALVMVAKDSGIRISDISLMDLGDFISARILETEDGRIKVFKPKATKKTGDIAHIHLGSEAIDSIEEYLETREDNDPALFLDESGKRVTSNAIKMLFMRLGKLTGRNKISAHSLRKFHRTRLEGAGMPEAWVKRLQGKAASVYSLPQQSGDLTKRYIECYHALRIFEEPERRIKELEDEVNRLRIREHEIDELRRVVQHQGELILKLMERANP